MHFFLTKCLEQEDIRQILHERSEGFPDAILVGLGVAEHAQRASLGVRQNTTGCRGILDPNDDTN